MTTIYSIQFRKNKDNKEYIITELRGLSTDTKPIKYGERYIDNGSVFVEIDTGKIFFYDLSTQTWKEA